MGRKIKSFVILVFCAFIAPAGRAQPSGPPPTTVSSTAGEIRIESLTQLEFPWGMTALPDGRLLITEKPGRLRLWSNNQLSEPLKGAPKVVYRGTRQEQGGLLDVEADPEFAQNQIIYLSYVEAAEQQPQGIQDTDDYRFPSLDLSDNIIRGGVVARARLDGAELRDLKVIWRQTPNTVGRGHFGHRLLFSADKKLFITSGDRMRFEPAQSLASNLGKVLRINSDGSLPSDNPFSGREGALGDIWSYGHRNILSAAFDSSGRLWVIEMGPLGGDELNLIEKGKNYGWPLVSNGSHYVRQSAPGVITAIPAHATSREYQAPVRSWTPVISPSGAAFYNGTMFKDWRGSLLVGGLSSQALVRLLIDGQRVAVEERVDMKRRIRDVLPAPDGAILVLVDAKEGALLRLTLAKEGASAR